MKTSYLTTMSQILKKGGTSTEIYEEVLNAGAPDCVARDLAGEPARAAANLARRKDKSKRKRPRLFMRTARDRRITKTRTKKGRLLEYHATKGWRSYRDVYGAVR